MSHSIAHSLSHFFYCVIYVSSCTLSMSQSLSHSLCVSLSSSLNILLCHYVYISLSIIGSISHSLTLCISLSFRLRLHDVTLLERCSTGCHITLCHTLLPQTELAWQTSVRFGPSALEGQTEGLVWNGPAGLPTLIQ